VIRRAASSSGRPSRRRRARASSWGGGLVDLVRLTQVRPQQSQQPTGDRAFTDTGRVLARTRSTVAWSALGHATAGYEIALEYCLHRSQFGKPLVSFQVVQDRLVKTLAEVCSIQLYCLRLARLQDDDQLTDTIAALAKMNNTRRAREVLATARDLLVGPRLNRLTRSASLYVQRGITCPGDPLRRLPQRVPGRVAPRSPA
jgi:glutaryl-CoA dehydrogenase